MKSSSPIDYTQFTADSKTTLEDMISHLNSLSIELIKHKKKINDYSHKLFTHIETLHQRVTTGDLAEKFSNHKLHVEAVLSNYLAWCYNSSTGIERDPVKALDLFTLAADQGLASAQFYLGYFYYKGSDVQKDMNKAIELLTLAEDKGNGEAQYFLGYFYDRGIGVEKDSIRARELFTKAAEQQHAEAQYRLGDSYNKDIKDKDGNIIAPRDAAKAVHYFQKAAQNGFGKAAKFLIEYASQVVGVISETAQLEVMKELYGEKFTEEQKKQVKDLADTIAGSYGSPKQVAFDIKTKDRLAHDLREALRSRESGATFQQQRTSMQDPQYQTGSLLVRAAANPIAASNALLK